MKKTSTTQLVTFRKTGMRIENFKNITEWWEQGIIELERGVMAYSAKARRRNFERKSLLKELNLQNKVDTGQNEYKLTLQETHQLLLERPINLPEVKRALFGMAAGKSPGSDRLPAEFYRYGSRHMRGTKRSFSTRFPHPK